MTDRRCKLGDLIASANDVARRDITDAIDSDSVRAVAERVAYRYGFVVGRETVRLHRSHECACYSLPVLVTPGEEAHRLATEQTDASSTQTPGDVLSSGSVAPVASQARLRSRWQTASGEWRESYEYHYGSSDLDTRNVDDLLAIIEQAKPTEREPRKIGAGAAYVVPVGDLQLGKPDGEGTAGIVREFCKKTLSAASGMRQFGGYNLEAVVLPWLGDCIEGNVSQGGKLSLDIGVSEQLRLYRRMILFQVQAFAPYCTKLIIPVVPGNHDETRRDVATHGTDSWAIEGAAAVADALQLNAAAYGHVNFVFPERGELTFAIDVAGTRLGFAHGHQWRPGEAEKWWQGQSFGRQAVGDADILLSAHLHHLNVKHCGDGRTWLQIPALDGGSDWFRAKTGANTPAGMVSFTVENKLWSGLTIY